MAQCSVQELFSAASAFASLPTPQLQIVQTVLLCRILQEQNPVATCDVQSLLTDASCFACLPMPQLAIIQTQLLCEILQGGGLSGNSCIVCGDSDPVADPGCDCAIGYNRTSGALFYWDSAQAGWVTLAV